MSLLTLGIILAVVALGIIIFLSTRAKRKRETLSNEDIIFPKGKISVSGIIPACSEEPVQKRWNTEETIIAFYLAKFGIDSFGPIKVFSADIKRSPSSLIVKVEIFNDLLTCNKTKNATKLDRLIFDTYSHLTKDLFYGIANNEISKLVNA